MDILLLERGEGRPRLAERLGEAHCRVVASLGDQAAIERALGQPGRPGQPDVIVLDLALPDPELMEWAGALGRRHDLPVAVFVEETDPVSIQFAMRAGISSYVVRGAHVDRLRDALEVARARFIEERSLRAELASVRGALAERKLIERAKGQLMTREGLDEQAAYDLLRRLAMRRSCRVAEIARAVLSGLPGS